MLNKMKTDVELAAVAFHQQFTNPATRHASPFEPTTQTVVQENVGESSSTSTEQTAAAAVAAGGSQAVESLPKAERIAVEAKAENAAPTPRLDKAERKPAPPKSGPPATTIAAAIEAAGARGYAAGVEEATQSKSAMHSGTWVTSPPANSGVMVPPWKIPHVVEPPPKKVGPPQSFGYAPHTPVIVAPPAKAKTRAPIIKSVRHVNNPKASCRDALEPESYMLGAAGGKNRRSDEANDGVASEPPLDDTDMWESDPDDELNDQEDVASRPLRGSIKRALEIGG